MLAAVRPAVFQQARSKGGAALEALPRYTLRTWIQRVSTHKTLHRLGLTVCLCGCFSVCLFFKSNDAIMCLLSSSAVR